MSLRVVHVIPSLGRGGAERTLVSLIDESELEHAVVVLGRGQERAFELRDTAVAPAASADAARVIKVIGALRQIQRLEPDVVHAWMYHADLIAGIAARLLGVPVIWSLRMSADPRGMSRGTWILTRLLCGPLQWLPTAIVACSHEVAASHRSIGLRRSIDVIENGFETRVLSDLDRRAARARHGLGEESFVIGRPGRWDPAKDHATLLRAVAEVPEGVRDRLVVLLAGRGVDAENSHLVAEISRLGLEGCVRLMGEEADMWDYYAACDVVCSSSITEGFPNVVAEAMAAGVPVVATDVGASARILGETGWLVPPGDPSALAGALSAAIATDHDELRSMGRRGQERIEGEFGLRKMVDAHRALYDRVLQED